MLQITKLSKNSPLLIDVAKRNEFGIVGGSTNCKDETVKRLPPKNSNIDTGHLTPKARLAFTKLKKAFTKAPIF